MFRSIRYGLVMAVVCVLVEMSRAGSSSEWNQEARDLVLAIHNDKRRGEGGCHINKLEYDMELESQAKRWAEGCVFRHELKGDRGENLAWNSAQKPEAELIKIATQSWFDEKKTYSYGQHSCSNSMSCHYTQMVWGSTSKVGCYSTRCSHLQGATSNAWYLVCFYTPKGNWNGEKPYDKGCSSPCLEGQTADNGLCVGVATGAGGRVDDEECDDDQGKCQIWAQNGQCQGNPEYMNKHCRKSCKLCESAGGSCEDLHAGCADWASRGECGRNPTYMSHNCQKSCNKC